MDATLPTNHSIIYNNTTNMNISDIQLHQYIDQVFARYDYNRTGTLNLPELHNFLNELFMMSGIPRNISYIEAYQALMQVDANRDGQVNKFELYNLFRFLTQPGFRPIPYTFGGYSYRGYGGVGAIGGIGGITSCGTTIHTIRQPVATCTTVTSSPVCLGAVSVGGFDSSWNPNFHGGFDQSWNPNFHGAGF